MKEQAGAWVRATPDLIAATEAHIGTFPSAWREKVKCATCDYDRRRGYMNDAGEHAPEPLPRLPVAYAGIDKEALALAGFEWRYCAVCHAHGYHEHLAIPAHTPAGALILATVDQSNHDALALRVSLVPRIQGGDDA